MPVTRPDPRLVQKGRGATFNPEGRFESLAREAADDGWNSLEEPLPARETVLIPDPARSIISRNESPDLGFSQSINPYRGCEHGCIYCYARPAHAYVNLSPGLDFETRIFYKPDAARLLEAELSKPGYECSMIMLAGNTDIYQPAERKLGITRALLEVMSRFNQPVGMITKGAALMDRDLDLIAGLARRNLVSVTISVTSLDDAIKRGLEPRTSSPAARLRLIRKLADAGVPVGVNVAPVVPLITDGEMEAILEAAAAAGARSAGYVLLRLPHEVAPLFRDWLQVHAPGKADHVMSLVRQARGGKDYDARFGLRQRGEGEYARMLQQRFTLACRRLGLNRERWQPDTSQFRVPPKSGDQLPLLA